MTIRIYERTLIQNFTLGSVAADSTGGGPLDFESTAGQNVFNGILRNVVVACDSTDFDVSIRSRSNGQENSIDEIYKATGISRYKSEEVHIGWVNNDSPISPNLYVVLVNNDPAQETGEVGVRIMTDINRPFAKYR